MDLAVRACAVALVIALAACTQERDDKLADCKVKALTSADTDVQPLSADQVRAIFVSKCMEA